MKRSGSRDIIDSSSEISISESEIEEIEESFEFFGELGDESGLDSLQNVDTQC